MDKAKEGRRRKTTTTALVDENMILLERETPLIVKRADRLHEKRGSLIT